MSELNAELTKKIALLEELLRDKSKFAEELQASELRYRRLFESAKDGILILDADTGEVVDVNPFLLQLLGYSYNELSGQHIWDLGVFKDIAASREAFSTLQDNEYIRYDDLPLETVDGRPVAVEFVSNVYYVNNSKVIQCNIRDITARKRSEAENRLLTEQLQQSRKMEAVGLLAGGVAHDYNNMLSVIMGNAEMALRKADSPEKLRDYLTEIINAAEYSVCITRQLLAFARKQTIVPTLFDLNRSVAEILKMLQRLIGEDIDLKWIPAPDSCPVKMDPVQLDQILTNLCVNARDAIDNVGRVTIETENVVFDEAYCARNAGFIAGKYVLLAVSDDGCGMDKKMLEQIFEPFFTSKQLGRGTGLGLSTVYGIVKQNGGFINVYSEPGNGATFRIYLPRSSGKVQKNHLGTDVDIPLGRGETVLLVEDEQALLKLAEAMLQELGYRVLAAGSPGEAIRLATENRDKITILVTDLVMPEMNGSSLAERLLSLCPGMKILFMSGYTANAIIHRGGVMNSNSSFIQKPFSIKELATKLRKAVSEK